MPGLVGAEMEKLIPGKDSIYPVPGYANSHNMWQKIATLRLNALGNPIFVPNPSHKY